MTQSNISTGAPPAELIAQHSVPQSNIFFTWQGQLDQQAIYTMVIVEFVNQVQQLLLADVGMLENSFTRDSCGRFKRKQ